MNENETPTPATGEGSGAIPMAEAGGEPGPMHTGTPEERSPQTDFAVSFDDAAYRDASETESETAPAGPGKTREETPPDTSSEVVPGAAGRAFAIMAGLGLLIPLVLVVLQTCLGLDARSLWFSDEVRHGAAYEALRQSGEWFILTLNGSVYPDKPPLYFWFLYGLDQIPHLDPPRLFLAAAALSALLFVAATWITARAMGYSKSIAFGACLVLLSSLSFVGITHYARMDLLFAALITLSHVCLYRGWIKASAPIWLIAGFALAALACLVKGPLGLAFPLISSIVFLVWRGSFRRAGGRDGAAGFAVMLIILLAWVSLVMLQEGGKDYLTSMFGKHMIERAVDAWHHKQPWWFYLVNMPLAWLPWTFLLFFLPWERLPRLVKGVARSRKEQPGHGWVWISFLGGFAVLSALSGKVGIYTLPLYPFLAILTAQGVLSMGPRRSRAFFLLLAFLFFVLAVVFGFAGAYPHIRGYLPDSMAPEALFDMSKPAFASALDYVLTLKGLPILAGLCLVFALLLGKGTRRAVPGGAMLVLALCVTALVQPLALVTAPSLDTLMSPKPQADIMRDYAAQGYHVTAFYVTTGTYTYHMGGVVDEINDWEELAQRLDAYPRIVVATRLRRWNEWQDKPELHPEAFRVVNTQWIAERQYVVLVRNASGGNAAAGSPSVAEPEKPAAEPPAEETPVAEEPVVPAPHEETIGTGPAEEPGGKGQRQPPEQAEPAPAPAGKPPRDTGIRHF